MENHLGSLLATRSEEGFRTALQISPGSASAMSGLALSIANHPDGSSPARLKEAEFLARTALLAAGNDRDVVRDSAEALGRAGRVDEALTINGRLLATYPEDTRMWLSRGVLENLAGNIYGATHAFGEAESIAREDEDPERISEAQEELREIHMGQPKPVKEDDGLRGVHRSGLPECLAACRLQLADSHPWFHRFQNGLHGIRGGFEGAA